MLFSNVFLRVLLAIFLSTQAFAEVLELGESQLHGKKDQPEAMTFVARAPINDSIEPVLERKISNKIKEEINSHIFDLVLVN